MSDPGAPLVLYSFWVLAAAWVVALGAGMSDLARIRAERRVVAWGLLIAVVALAVRLAAPASQHDLNDRLAVANLDPGEMWVLYGMGVPSLARLTFWVWGPDHTVLFHLFAVLGTLLLLPLAAVMRGMGASWRATGWGVAWLALCPPHLRYSHTDLQAIPESLLFLWGWWAAMQQRWWLAGLSLGIVCHMRPESSVMAVVLASWLVLHRPEPTRGLALGGAIWVAIAWPQWALAVDKLLNRPDSPAHWTGTDLGPLHFLWVDPAFVAPVGVVGISIGLVRANEVALRDRVWLLAWALGLGLMIPEWDPRDAMWVFSRHQVRELPFAAALFGLGLSTVTAALQGPARHAVEAATVTLLAVWVPVGWTPTADNEEYLFFAEQFPALPDRCTMIDFDPPDDQGLTTPQHLSLVHGKDHTWLSVDDPLPERGCRIYYRGANCYVSNPISDAPRPDGRARLNATCRQFEDRHVLTPLVTTSVTRVSSGLARYGPGRLEVGFFQVEP